MECTLCYDNHKNSDELFAENELCFAVKFPEPNINGWVMILPKRHCETVFDMNEDEVSDTFRLLKHVREKIDFDLSPDGYNVGWNCYSVGGQTTPHAHMHVMPRYKDEKHAGKGIRYWYKKG